MRAPLFLVILLPITLSAQTTWAPVGAQWTYRTSTLQSPWPIPYGQYTVSVIGDTIINDEQCSIIHFPWGTDCGFPYMSITQRDVYTCVHGDSILWYNALSDDFDLIMDFGALPGAQWSVPLYNEQFAPYGHDTMTYTIDMVDTLWHAGIPLRRLHYSLHGTTGVFQTLASTEIIERLGDTWYMFPWRTCTDGTFEYPLLCYSEVDFSWPNNGVTCDIWLGAEPNGASIDPFSSANLVSVALVNEAVTITGPFPGRLEAFDAAGRRVVDRTFQGTSELVFQTAGLHIVRFSNGGSSPQVRRVMVH